MVFGRKKEKVVLRESEKEKRARKLAAMAKDPSKALAAEEPFEQAQTAPIGISLLKHKDQYGNDIVDPDRSNPTRHRLERPLDTIRGFERAIFREEEEKRMSRYETGTERGGYTAASSRRQSMVRSQDSFNNGNGRIQRNESFNNSRQYREANQRMPYNNYQQGMSYNNYQQGQPMGDQQYYADGDVPSPSVDTGSGSYASRGWNGSSNDAYSTNPSSESSSYRGREREYNEQNGGPPVPKKTPSPLSKSQAAYSNHQQENGGMRINRKPVPTSNHQGPAGYASPAAVSQAQGQGHGEYQNQTQGYYDYNSYNNPYNGNNGSQDNYYDAVSPVSPVDGQNGFGGRQQQQYYQQNGNSYEQRSSQQQGGYFPSQPQQQHDHQQQPQQQQQQYKQNSGYNHYQAAVQDYTQRRPNTLSKQNSSASQKPARQSWLKRTFSKNHK